MKLRERVFDAGRWLLFTLVTVAPLVLHAFYIAPKLFAHGSSSAFDLAMGLYVILCLLAVYGQLYFPIIKEKRPQ